MKPILIIYLLITFYLHGCMETVQNMQMQVAEEKIAANKKLAEYWIYEGWNNNRNMEIIDSVFAQDWHDFNPIPGTPWGIAGAKYYVNVYRQALPDIQFKITHLIAEPEYVTFRFTAEATHRDALLGVPATNKRISLSGIVIHNVKDGRFVESFNEIDLFGIYQQITQ